MPDPRPARFSLNGTTFEGSVLEIRDGAVLVDGTPRGSVMGIACLRLIEGLVRLDACDVRLRVIGNRQA